MNWKGPTFTDSGGFQAFSLGSAFGKGGISKVTSEPGVVDAEDNEADAFFPDYSEFKTIISQKESSDSQYKYKFVELSR